METSFKGKESGSKFKIETEGTYPHKTVKLVIERVSEKGCERSELSFDIVELYFIMESLKVIRSSMEYDKKEISK